MTAAKQGLLTADDLLRLDSKSVMGELILSVGLVIAIFPARRTAQFISPIVLPPTGLR